MAIITREQYKALTPEEQKNYCVYQPFDDNEEAKESFNMISAQQKVLQKLVPLHDKLKAVPTNLPAEKLEKMVSTFEKINSLNDAIKKLASNKVLKPLIQPLVEVLNSLIEIIGIGFYLTFAVSRGQEIFTDGIIDAVDQTDWDGLKDSMEAMKQEKKNLEKAKQRQKEKDELEKKKLEEIKKKKEQDPTYKTEEELVIEAQRQQIRDELSGDLSEICRIVDETYDKIQIADSTARITKHATKLACEPYSWKKGTVTKEVKKILQSVGLKLDPLDQPTEDQRKAFDKSFPDPALLASKANNSINKLNKNTKYILISEKKNLDTIANTKTTK